MLPYKNGNDSKYCPVFTFFFFFLIRMKKNAVGILAMLLHGSVIMGAAFLQVGGATMKMTVGITLMRRTVLVPIVHPTLTSEYHFFS